MNDWIDEGSRRAREGVIWLRVAEFREIAHLAGYGFDVRRPLLFMGNRVVLIDLPPEQITAHDTSQGHIFTPNRSLA